MPPKQEHNRTASYLSIGLGGVDGGVEETPTFEPFSAAEETPKFEPFPAAEDALKLFPTAEDGRLPIRRLSVAGLEMLESKGHLMPGWQKQVHTNLDFSSEIFALATMQPQDFQWSRTLAEADVQSQRSSQRTSASKKKGVEFFVGKLQTLKLDSNQITDADFDPAKEVGLCNSAFSSLRVLRMQSNCLAYPMIMMPRLRELDLTNNKLVQVPTLVGLRDLESLNLSHNQIKELNPRTFRESAAAGLVSLNLRSNRIHTSPSVLYKVFENLAKKGRIQTLKLADNPFCCYFTEYQMLAVQVLPKISTLDHLVSPPNASFSKEFIELRAVSKSFFGTFESNVISKDGSVIDIVNSVDSIPRTTEAEMCALINKVLKTSFGVEVSRLDDAKAYLILDRCKTLDSEIEIRRRMVSMDSMDTKSKDDYTEAEADVARQDRENKRKILEAEAKINASPLLSSMIAELDEAIAGHTKIMNSAKIVFSKAGHVASMGADSWEDMFSDMTAKKSGRPDLAAQAFTRQENAKLFAEQVVMLAERHADARVLLIRTLAKFSPISNHAIGTNCLSGLAVLAQGDDSTRMLVLDSVRDIVLPAINEGMILSDATGALYEGVAKLSCEGLADILRSSVSSICTNFKLMIRSVINAQGAVRKMNQRLEAITKLLELLVSMEGGEVAKEAIGEEILITVTEFLSRDTIFLASSHECWSYIGCVKIVLWCLHYFPEKATEQLLKSVSLHTELVVLIAEVDKKFGALKEIFSYSRARKMGSALELLSELAKSRTVMDDLAMMEDNLPLSVALKAPCSGSLADPVHLAGSMKLLCTMLYDAQHRHRFAGPVIKALDLVEANNKIWGFIDGGLYKVLYNNCHMHSSWESVSKMVDTGAEEGTVMLEVTSIPHDDIPEIAKCDNQLLFNVLVAVIDFLKVFSALASDNPKDLFSRVSARFNDAGRETLLFNLLAVMSPDVQEAVMRCLADARLEELDEDEVQQLLLLVSTRSSSPLLIAVLDVINQFMSKDGEEADKFRINYAKNVISRTMDLLGHCSGQHTFNATEEKTKMTLAQKCLNVLVTAGRRPWLRKYLRGDVAKDFCKILKDHETMDDWCAMDISIELVWTGRHIELLLSCLNTASPYCLRRDKKQAFRIFNRIADVMAGVAEGAVSTSADSDNQDQMTSAQDRAAAEAIMWNGRTMQKEARLLDDHTFEDQIVQQLMFFSFNGVERMVHFLESGPDQKTQMVEGASAETSKGAAVKKSALDVVVDLCSQAKDILKELQAEVHAMDKDVEESKEDAKKQSKPEMTEMDDVSPLKIGASGETLLRQVFVSEGFKEHRTQSKRDASHATAQAAKSVFAATSQVSDVGLEVGAAAEGGQESSLLDDLIMRSFDSQPLFRNEACPTSTPMESSLLQRSADFFSPGSDGIVLPPFFLASTLRTFFAALTTPTTQAVYDAAKACLTEPIIQLRLYMLLEKCNGYLHCNIGAKLLRIFAHVLQLPPDQSTVDPEENDWRHCTSLVIAAGFAGRTLSLLVPKMSHLGSNGVVMDVQQVTLAKEAVELINVILKSVAKLKWSSHETVQEEALQRMVLLLVPMQTLKAVFLLLLYDMQVNTGSRHGASMTMAFACKTIMQQSLHSLCTDTMSRHMYLSPSVLYEVIEFMNQYKIMGQYKVHDSFLSELWDRKEAFRLRKALEDLLELQNGHDAEKVLQVAWAEMPEDEDGTYLEQAQKMLGMRVVQAPRLVALTNQRLLIMGRSRHGTSKTPCGICPPESFCPVGPDLDRSYSYPEITRLMCSLDPQMLIFGHVDRSKVSGHVVGEVFVFLVFHTRDARTEFKERLVTLTSNTSPTRIFPTADAVIGKAVKSKTASNVVLTTWAFREIQDPSTPEGHTERLSLFVLTELNFFEFEVDFSVWLPGSEMFDNEPFYSDEEYLGAESDDEMITSGGDFDVIAMETAPEFVKLMRKATTTQNLSRFKHIRLEREEPSIVDRERQRARRRQEAPPNEWLMKGMPQFKTSGGDTVWDYLEEAKIDKCREDRHKARDRTEQKLFFLPGAAKEEEAGHMVKRVREARKAVLKQHVKCPITSVKQVDFGHTDLPTLSLRFEARNMPVEEVTIRFMCDAARERWRRNLQFVLVKNTDGSMLWTRNYTSEEVNRASAPRRGNSAKFFAKE